MPRVRSAVLLAALVAHLAGGASAAVQVGHTADEWKSRTIYQLLTDRFSKPGASGSDCSNLQSYCGGTWAGIEQQLDYITGMGFDAIWITPVVDNTPGGYHGYWQRDMTELNSNFGSASDLVSMVNAAHAKGVWVMVDIVANHMGNDPNGVDSAGFNPFNDTRYFHDCNGCDSNCDISDFTNQPQVEHCRLAGLPDLNQSLPYVSTFLYTWASGLISKYGFDGIRADTVPEINPPFWAGMQQKVGCYMVGEVYNGNIPYVASYQQNALDGVLSYPLFFTLRDVFANGNSLYELQSTLQAYQSNFKDLDLLATFLDNHDQARFLSVGGSDTWRYKNGITYTLMAQGIPIIYYGTEQAFNGGNDPNNREALWRTSFDTTSDLYTFIKTVMGFRKSSQPWTSPQVQRYADDTYYAFTRGTTFVSLTNVGAEGSPVSRTITYHPYSDGTKLCNVFYPTTDCVTVQNKQFTVKHLHGEPKIYYPSS